MALLDVFNKTKACGDLWLARGPSSADMAAAPAPPRYFVVSGRAGAQVRKTMSLQSARVKILDAGAVVASDKETHLEDGRLRIHICAPVEGWLSAKTVARAPDTAGDAVFWGGDANRRREMCRYLL